MAWTDILEQELAKRILQAHLAQGQSASGYLLAGPPGVGKKRLALELAKALNCTHEGPKPCDACRTCLQIIRATHPDVHQVAPGGAGDLIKIDQIRHIIGRVALRPFNARCQVVIIESADRMTEEAANSLLKALEEPAATTKFVLTTAQAADCLPTIVSRCQVIRCHPLSAETVERILTGAHEISADTARAAAALSQGSASRALALAQRWGAHEQLLKGLAGDTAAMPAPETRQDVADLLEAMIVRLRDRAAASPTPDVDRCLETAEALIRLRESVDQYVSPRLIASVAREKWLALHTP